MVKKYILAGGFAVFCAGAVANAQSTTPQQPTQTPPSSTAQATTTTVEGCVYRESDIPGHSANVAERAGIGEDYVLVAMDKSASGTAGTSGTSGTASSTGSSMMKAKLFKLENADDSKLSSLVGKRVRVVGKAEAEHGAMSGTSTAKPQTGQDMDMPEFQVSTISESTGTCPAKPEIKK